MTTRSGPPEPRRDERLQLDGNRNLAWCEWGPHDGRPVLLFHGMPGSRFFCPDLAATLDAGVRMITYDRPGYGRSDPVEGQRKLDGYVPDVLALLDHLELDHVSAVGWSGGGCFAAALGALAAPRLGALALVSAPGPLDEVPGAWEALGSYRRPTAEMAREDPQRSRRVIARHMEPFVSDPVSFLGTGRGADRDALADPVHGPMLRRQIEEGLAPGGDGLAADLVSSWLDWGFRLDEIKVRTVVFHGALDPNNGADARVYSQAVPNATLVRWPAAGHLGVVSHWPEVLAATADK